ncbi:hypothetical protein Gobs01_04093 [Geodermatophilus obscurus DSM 43160]
MRLVAAVLRLTRKPRMATPERARRRMAEPKTPARPPARLVRRHDVSSRDPWLSSAGLREAGRAWVGGDDPTGPRLSPGNGPLAGLAPMPLVPAPEGRAAAAAIVREIAG